MNPEEKVLLKHTLKLAEENNSILHKMQRTARWALAWGFIKVMILLIPLVVGFILLQPYFEPIRKVLESITSSETYSILLSNLSD